MKTAFVFPGQGSQYIGMGRELAERYPPAAAVFVEADQVLGFSLSRLCFEGPAEQLVQNEVVQPAILVASMAAYSALTAEGVAPDLVAGLSVGEYTALVAGGALDFQDAVWLLRRRGEIMKNALPPGTGGMLAVIGLGRDEVKAMCTEVSHLGVVEPCNYNCPGQIVVGGALAAIEALESLALSRGVRKVSRVAMSSPSHCSLLREAAVQLEEELSKVKIRDARLPVVANVNAQPAWRAEELRVNLSRQLCQPVLWEDCLRQLEKMGARHIIEVGPGHTLLGFVRKTLRGIGVSNVEDLNTLNETLELLGKKEVKVS